MTFNVSGPYSHIFTPPRDEKHIPFLHFRSSLLLTIFRSQCSTAPLVKHWCHLRNFRPGCIESSPTYAITIPKKFLPQFLHTRYVPQLARPPEWLSPEKKIRKNYHSNTTPSQPHTMNTASRRALCIDTSMTENIVHIPVSVPNYSNRRRTISRFSFLSISTQYRYRRVEGYRRLLSSSFGCMLILNND
jgi:hypothetical protein